MTHAAADNTSYTSRAITELARRTAARRSLLAFTRYTKPDYAVNWHHKTIARVLTDVVDGLTPDPALGDDPRNWPADNPYGVLNPHAPKRVILCVPPRNGKSELASRRLPAYALGRNPDLEIIATSYGADLASMMNRDVQQIIDAPEYAKLFPDTKLNSANVRTTAQGSYLRNNDIFEIVGRKGQYRSGGIGGALTGMGAMLGIIDDPVKNRDEADSETYREKIWRWFTSTFRTRLDNPNAAIVIMLTRWHEDDLAGRLLKLEADNADAERWQLISLPALLDDIPDPAEDAKRYQSYIEFDQRRTLGEPLWPARFPLTTLRALKVYNPEDYEALQQQRPTIPGGAMFPRAKFRIIDRDDWIAFDSFTFVRGWDKGGTEDGGAYTAGVLIAYDPDRRYGVNFIVIDTQRIQYEELNRERLIRQTAQLDASLYGDVMVFIEQEPGSGGKDSALNTIRNTLAGFDAEKEPASGKGQKATRWRPFSAQVKADNVALVAGDWVEAYLAELSKLPSGKYKDQADASAIAFNRLALGWREELIAIVSDPELISDY
jgi:predicted phage terminase large subunit-like protein